jgi:hypothetical protein
MIFQRNMTFHMCEGALKILLANFSARIYSSSGNNGLINQIDERQQIKISIINRSDH